jgi:hypothetical protein
MIQGQVTWAIHDIPIHDLPKYYVTSGDTLDLSVCAESATPAKRGELSFGSLKYDLLVINTAFHT